MLNIHYSDNPSTLLKHYLETLPREELPQRAALIHEELLQWYLDHEEQLQTIDNIGTLKLGTLLTRAGRALAEHSYKEVHDTYEKAMEHLHAIQRQDPALKHARKKLDKHYTTILENKLPYPIILSEEFVHELQKRNMKETEHLTTAVQELNKNHHLINAISTGEHNHHETPHSLKYYPKSKLWGIRCGNKHELAIFSYRPEKGYALLDYIDRHTHDEATTHRGRYYELYAIGSRTEKTYNTRNGKMLSNTRGENTILYPFELNTLTTEELNTLGV